MNARTVFVTAALTACGLSACAGEGGRYPSLGLREVERRTFVLPAATPAPLAPALPADTTRIGALRASAAAAHGEFVEKQRAAATLVSRARGAGPDSRGRAAALVALADLAAARSATFLPLGELDRIAADTAADFGNTEPAITAQTWVAALVEQQDAALDALWRELGQ